MKENTTATEQEDLLRTYYAAIKRVALLTADEEKELSRRISEGDEEARRRLIEANLRLVVKIARAYVTQDMVKVRSIATIVLLKIIVSMLAKSAQV